MALHPDAARFLERCRAEGTLPDHLLDVAEVRARADLPAPAGEEVRAVQDLVVPAGDHPVPVRVYTPVASPAGVVVYLHGGGHVTGTLDSYDGLTRRLANRVPAVVVAVGYRRAPEHRCPAAVDDAEAAYRWVLEHRRQLVADPRAGVVVAGDSAGGNNAAVLARRVRDAGLEAPALQVLVYPTLDAVAYREGTRYPSYTECAPGFGLTYPDGLSYWDHYLGPDGDPGSPDASPLRAASVAGLPPAYVLTVEHDVLRDEGLAYADRLRAAGVAVQSRHWPGHLHGFLGSPDLYEDAETAMTEIGEAVAAALSRRA